MEEVNRTLKQTNDELSEELGELRQKLDIVTAEVSVCMVEGWGGGWGGRGEGGGGRGGSRHELSEELGELRQKLCRGK